MLHELLLALLGFTGDLIVDEREQLKTLGLDSPLSDESTFKLAPDISFIQPSERYSLSSRSLLSDRPDFDFSRRDLIEGLIKLGFYYRELDRFANKSRNLSWIRSVTSVHPLERADELSKQSSSSGEKKPSVYRRAIANGIVEILSVYRSAVLHIEQKLLAETTPILATVTQGLNKVHFSTTREYYIELRITV